MSKRRKNKKPDYIKRVVQAFDTEALARVCAMHETEFEAYYGMERTDVDRDRWTGEQEFYCFKDNGSNLLAVAHLDTVMPHSGRRARFVETEAGVVVFSGALDDRLGAYVILELLPAMGIVVDVLLTTGEEQGRSTAQYFDAPQEKAYNWGIEFDRGGTDVVMYEYQTWEMENLVKASGATVGIGAFSDISYMEHVGIKMFNWGVGYQDYHGPRSHAFLDDTVRMVARWLKFHAANKDFYLPHVQEQRWNWRQSYRDYESEWERLQREIEAEEKEFLAGEARAKAKGHAQFECDDPDCCPGNFEGGRVEGEIDYGGDDQRELIDAGDLVSEYPTPEEIERVLEG